MDSADIAKLNDYKETLLFKSIELNENEVKYIGDFYDVQAEFNMLFELLPGRGDTIQRGRDDTIQRLIIDYYNNFRVKISYPTEIVIKGKFIIGKNHRGKYELDSHGHDDFLVNDFLEEDREQVKANYAVAMMSLETCKPLYFFDDFLQNNEPLASGKVLKNAEYWRIPPPQQSCKEFNELVEKFKKFKKFKIAFGGKLKKKRIMRTKRKRNKRTRRTKRR
jgi:hypothetical protein